MNQALRRDTAVMSPGGGEEPGVQGWGRSVVPRGED